jgi:ferredoxin
MPLVENRADVPVTIDASLCIEGCTLCVDICPLDSLAINPDSGKAYMHVDECWYCGPCSRSLRQRRRPRLRPARRVMGSPQ